METHHIVKGVVHEYRDDRTSENTWGVDGISLSDILKIPEDATYYDFEKHFMSNLFKGLVIGVNAREGGKYFFSFLPTNEIPRSWVVEGRSGLPLVAVIWSSSGTLYDDGLYVWPNDVIGQRFTGVTWIQSN